MILTKRGEIVVSIALIALAIVAVAVAIVTFMFFAGFHNPVYEPVTTAINCVSGTVLQVDGSCTPQELFQTGGSK